MTSFPLGTLCHSRTLGVAGVALFGVALSVGPVHAQTPTQTPPTLSARLSVRPATMATGTQNPAAGDYPLDSLPNLVDQVRTSPYTVHVPPQCVGAHRCPLLLVLHGAGMTSASSLGWARPIGDRQGIIILAGTALGTWWQDPHEEGASTAPDWENIDAALQQTLQKFAIAPDQIAVLGRCNGGVSAIPLGAENLDVFSRIITVSGGEWVNQYVEQRPTDRTTEILLEEEIDQPLAVMRDAQRLRDLGYPVKVMLPLRSHRDQDEDYAYVGHWLHESWATPDAAARTAPQVVDVTAMPLLTVDALGKLKAFWDNFGNATPFPVDQRMPYLHEVVLPVGTGADQPSTWIMDMVAVAAHYPTVAAALQRAGLTPQEHDAYRVAVISAAVAGGFSQVGRQLEDLIGPVDSASTLGKNRAFLEAHQDAFNAFAGGAAFDTP